jgi:hypothetical protein
VFAFGAKRRRAVSFFGMHDPFSLFPGDEQA